MKKNVRVLSLVVLLCMMLGNFAACKNGKDENNENNAPKEMITLVANEKSDYVLIYQQKDILASYFANSLWTLIYNNCKTSLVKRGDDSSSDYEIVLCDANREGVASLKAQMKDASDFVIRQDGNRLYLYAENQTGIKRMMITLRDVFLKDSPEGTFAVEKDLLYVGSQHPAESYEGDTVTLFDGSKSDYTIIYDVDSEDDVRVATFLRREFKNAFGINLEMGGTLTKESECEILLGVSSVKRDAFKKAKSVLKKTNDFIITVSDKKLVVVATDPHALVMAAEYLINHYVIPSKGGVCSISESEEYTDSISGGYEVDRSRLEYLYRNVLDRYPTLREYYLNSGQEVPFNSKKDQEMIEVLIRQMGESAVFCNGSSSVLYNGMICKLDTTDYSRVAALSANGATVPTEFINSYLKTDYTELTVDLKQAAESAGYTYYYDSARQLAIVSPPGAYSFEDDTVQIEKHTNASFKDRMLAFFNNPAMPEPQNNTEQSRVEIAGAENYYPEDALDFTLPSYTCNYSPSIVSVELENGKTLLYASYEECTVVNGAEVASKTHILHSTDGGKTWVKKQTYRDLKWASLIEVGNRVYIWGYLKPYCAIAEVTDGAKTNPLSNLFEWICCSVFEPLVDNGYLYMALDNCVASIEVDKDLTVPSNWTTTPGIGEYVNKKWFEDMIGKPIGQWGMGNAYCQEGVVVKGRDGEIYAIYRVESQPYGNYAVKMKLSEDRTTLEYLPDGGSVINIPTTVSRFVIKYDEVSDKYVMISNLWLSGEIGNRTRNVLGLSVSDDLSEWTVVDTLLVDREMINSDYSCYAHAFQYTDFDFDGEDLVLAVREATGFTNTFHDGKYLTFYRVTDFRSMFS